MFEFLQFCIFFLDNDEPIIESSENNLRKISFPNGYKYQVVVV